MWGLSFQPPFHTHGHTEQVSCGTFLNGLSLAVPFRHLPFQERTLECRLSFLTREMGRRSQPPDNNRAPQGARGGLPAMPVGVPRARCSHALGTEFTQPIFSGGHSGSFPISCMIPARAMLPGTTPFTLCRGGLSGQRAQHSGAPLLSPPGGCPSAPATPREVPGRPGPFLLSQARETVAHGGHRVRTGGRRPWIPWKRIRGGAQGEGKACLSSWGCSDARNFLD